MGTPCPIARVFLPLLYPPHTPRAPFGAPSPSPPMGEQGNSFGGVFPCGTRLRGSLLPRWASPIATPNSPERPTFYRRGAFFPPLAPPSGAHPDHHPLNSLASCGIFDHHSTAWNIEPFGFDSWRLAFATSPHLTTFGIVVDNFFPKDKKDCKGRGSGAALQGYINKCKNLPFLPSSKKSIFAFALARLHRNPY